LVFADQVRGAPSQYLLSMVAASSVRSCGAIPEYISLWVGGTIFTLQQNLYLMHHLWPSVPFYNYHRLYRRLRSVLLEKGSRIEDPMTGAQARDKGAQSLDAQFASSHAAHSDKCCLVGDLASSPPNASGLRRPNASVSTVLIEKRRNEIAMNWVKRS
jgi:hypothetical protein